VRGALDVAEAWGWTVASQPARVTLDRLLCMLWSLTHGRARWDNAEPRTFTEPGAA
jgi:hypothetical protein